MSDLMAKGIIRNGTMYITEFRETGGGVWNDFGSLVGWDLLDAIVVAKRFEMA